MSDNKKKSLFPSAKELEQRNKEKINESILFIRKVSMSRWQLISMSINAGSVTDRTVLKDDLPMIVLGIYDRMIRGAAFHAITD